MLFALFVSILGVLFVLFVVSVVGAVVVVVVVVVSVAVVAVVAVVIVSVVSYDIVKRTPPNLPVLAFSLISLNFNGIILYVSSNRQTDKNPLRLPE